MTESLKPGTTKLKKAKYPTELLVALILIILVGIPSFACTRSVSEPVQLTEAAIRFEVTKIGLQTAIPDQILAIKPHATEIALLPTAAKPTLIYLVPMNPNTAAVTEATAAQAIEVIQTATPKPTQESSPTPRNTFPVEPIDPGFPLYREPTRLAYQPATAEPFIQQPDISAIEITPQESLPELITFPTERLLYVTQNGDSLQGIANRFGVAADQVSSIQPITSTGFLNPNVTLFIASAVNRTYSSPVKIIPDEYVIFSRTAANYDLSNEINQAGGYLATYREELADGFTTGTEIVDKVCKDFSINPIVMLALLEFKSNWVYGFPKTAAERDYPLGWIDASSKGLHKQLLWAAGTLSKGYYGWRYGTVSEIQYYKYPRPPQTIYFEPTLNAGSVAIQHLFAQLYPWNTLDAAIYGEGGFYSTFTGMFGNVWENFIQDSNGLNADLRQPSLTMPFSKTEGWALTGGPHPAWSTGSPFGALDFAPPSQYHGCAESDRYVLSASAGRVIRTGTGTVVVDLDGDGLEETGWVLLYLHIATKDKIYPGSEVSIGTKIGHPSCEGGAATGTHVHIARKYNGEWINATGSLPFSLSGWVPFEGSLEYLGGLTRGNEVIRASQVGSGESIVRY